MAVLTSGTNYKNGDIVTAAVINDTIETAVAAHMLADEVYDNYAVTRTNSQAAAEKALEVEQKTGQSIEAFKTSSGQAFDGFKQDVLHITAEQDDKMTAFETSSRQEFDSFKQDMQCITAEQDDKMQRHANVVNAQFENAISLLHAVLKSLATTMTGEEFDAFCRQNCITGDMINVYCAANNITGEELNVNSKTILNNIKIGV